MSIRVTVRAPVHDDEFDVNIFAILVQKVGHEVGHRLVRDVTTQDDMPVQSEFSHDMTTGSLIPTAASCIGSRAILNDIEFVKYSQHNKYRVCQNKRLF